LSYAIEISLFPRQPQDVNFFVSPAFNLIWFVVGTVAFGVFAIYAYYRPRKVLRWQYSVASFNLIGGWRPLSDDFLVLYKNKSVDRVTASKVLLYNSGHVAIKADEIAKGAPLELHISDGKFLDYSLSAESNKASAFKLTPLDNRIAINFSHLNAGDGVVFSVLHTAGSNADLQISGELIGFGPPRLYKYDPPGTTGCIVVLIFFTIFLLSFLFVVPGCAGVRSLDQNVYGPTIISLVILVPLWLFAIQRLLTQPILPKPLRDFYQIEEGRIDT
jgi:hypothetical protein